MLIVADSASVYDFVSHTVLSLWLSPAECFFPLQGRNFCVWACFFEVAVIPPETSNWLLVCLLHFCYILLWPKPALLPEETFCFWLLCLLPAPAMLCPCESQDKVDQTSRLLCSPRLVHLIRVVHSVSSLICFPGWFQEHLSWCKRVER